MERQGRVGSAGRAPRVEWLCEVARGERLPFVVGVVADLSIDAPRAPAEARPLLEVDRDELDALLAHVGPTASATLPGAERPTPVRVTSFAGFTPDGLLEELDALGERLARRRGQQRLLRATRRSGELGKLMEELLADAPRREAAVEQLERDDEGSLLADIFADADERGRARDDVTGFLRSVVERADTSSRSADAAIERHVERLDAELSDALRAVLDAPPWRRAEDVWLGLRRLVRRAETGADLRLAVFDAGDDELPGLCAAGGVLDARLDGARAAQRPVGLLLFEAEPDPDDGATLAALARLGARARVPVVVSAPRTWCELADDGDAPPPAALAALRAEPDARWLVLVGPRRLVRDAWSAGGHGVQTLPFEEGLDGAPAAPRWGSAAWLVAEGVVEAWSRTGWFASLHGADAGVLDELPVQLRGAGPDSEVVGPLEHAWSDARVAGLAERGLAALRVVRGTRRVALGRLGCCAAAAPAASAASDGPDASAASGDALPATLPLLLVLSHLARNVEAVAAHFAADGPEVAAAAGHAWLTRLVGGAGQDRLRRPLAAASVERADGALRVSVRPALGVDAARPWTVELPAPR